MHAKRNANRNAKRNAKRNANRTDAGASFALVFFVAMLGAIPFAPGLASGSESKASAPSAAPTTTPSAATTTAPSAATTTAPSTAPSTADLGSEIKVGVRGMVCAFCAQGITKIFRAQNEVESVEVSIEKKFVKLKFKSGQRLSQDKIAELLKQAGFVADFGG